MGAAIDGFVVRWDQEAQSLQGFHIEAGDDVADVATIMKELNFDPDGIRLLVTGTKTGKTKTFLRKRRGNDFKPLLTVSAIATVLEEVVKSSQESRPGKFLPRAGYSRIW
jgi:hypothetical protein